MTGYITQITEFFPRLQNPVSNPETTENTAPAPDDNFDDDSVGNTENSNDNSILGKIFKVRDSIENRANQVNFKYSLIELNGLFQRCMGKRYIVDAEPTRDVYRLSSGHLTSIAKSEWDTGEIVDKLVEVNTYLNKENIDLLYVQAPHKNAFMADQLPVGVEDFTGDNVSSLMKAIGKADIPYLDLKQELLSVGIEPVSAYFKTDHHWLPETALSAWFVIAPRLTEEFGFDIDENTVLADQYTYNMQKDVFLGSYGRRVGMLYSGVDNLTLIYPKFQTNLELRISSRDVYRSGDFEDAIYDYRRLEYSDIHESSQYSVYTGGDYDLTQIKNNAMPDGKHVLLVKDSFSCAFAPFLALGCSQVDMIDLRYFNESVYKFIDENKPDMVIIFYNSSVISGLGAEMFDFEK